MPNPRILLALLAVASASAAHAAPAKPDHVMTLATIAPADSPWSALLVMYKESIEKRTGGKLRVKLMLGGVLGDENEMVTKAARGQVQAVGVSTGALATKVPEVNLIELPFLFQNLEEADRIIDGVLTEPLEKFFRDRGLVLGFWNENGYRSFATRDKAVKTPQDLKGRKMRSQESPIHMAMYKAFGAAAVPIPATEVMQSLATGNVDGFDQGILYMIAAGWHKSIKHVTFSEHIYQAAAISFNKAWFDKLPPEMRKILIEEGRSLQGKGRKAVRAIQPELEGILTFEKIQTHRLSPAERQAFVEASKPVYAEFRKSFGPEAAKLLDRVEAELKKIRE